MVTDEEVAAALGLIISYCPCDWAEYDWIDREGNFVFCGDPDFSEPEWPEKIKSAVREKWCTENRSIVIWFDLEGVHLYLKEFLCNRWYVRFRSRGLELECWKEALVWLDKKEKENASAS